MLTDIHLIEMIPVGIWIRISPQYPWFVVRGDDTEWFFR